ncbi:MAG TPA: putative zinc-binding metallopeptidase, partial [Devosia sp.]
FNVRAQPEADQDGSLAVEVGDDPYVSPDFSIVASNWVPLVLLLNNLNRAVGQPDVYPFVLSPRILEKLSFIHRLVHRQGLPMTTDP